MVQKITRNWVFHESEVAYKRLNLFNMGDFMDVIHIGGGGGGGGGSKNYSPLLVNERSI